MSGRNNIVKTNAAITTWT